MLTYPTRSFSASDLRRPEVLDAAAESPVAVRDGRSGETVIMLPYAIFESNNEVLRLAILFTRTVVECQRPDPSPAHLDEVAYIVTWSAERRATFVRGFAEAMSATITANSAAPARAFIEYMAHADDVTPAQFQSSFLDRFGSALADHVAG